MEALALFALATLAMIWIVVPLFIAGLRRRLTTLETQQSERLENDALERHLNALARRLDKAEAELGRLGGTGTGLSEVAPPADEATMPAEAPIEVTAPAVPEERPEPSGEPAPLPSVAFTVVDRPIAKAPEALHAPGPADQDQVQSEEEEDQEVPPAEDVPVETVTSGSTESWEVALGTSWLNKIGIVVLSIGVVFFLSYTLQNIGPLGKAVVGLVLGSTLLGLGVVAERRERYQKVARALFGGGWAIVYITTYAMHHVEAMHLIESPAVALLLLLAVAAGMVGHTLRYNSELATGFAYGIGFLSLALMHGAGMTSLVAAAVLAASLVFVLARRRWYLLEPIGVGATYLVHFVWIRSLVAAAGDPTNLAAGVETTSATLLTIYWIIWSVSSFVRVERDATERTCLAVAAILNGGGYLAVLAFQSTDPSRGFFFFLTVGLAYFAQAALARRLGLRTIFVLTSTLGTLLTLVAFPFRFGDTGVRLLWMAEAQALLVAGWRLGERQLRHLGWAAGALVVAAVLGGPVAARAGLALDTDLALGIECVLIGLVALLNARLTGRLLGPAATVLDLNAAQLSHVAGTVVLLASALVALPPVWVGIAWLTIALGLGVWGARVGDSWLLGCAHGSAAAALVSIASATLPEREGLLLAAAAAGYFANARWLPRLTRRETTQADDLVWNLSYVAGTYFAMAAIWALAPSAWVGVAWMGLAIGLGEWGARARTHWLQACAHATAAVALVRLLELEQALPATELLGISQRLISLALAGGLLYVESRRLTSRAPLPSLDLSRVGGWSALYSWAAGLVVAFLLWLFVTPAGVALGWGLFGLALIELGRWRDDVPFRRQGHVLMVAALIRIFIVDLNVTTVVGGVPTRLLTVGLLAAVYYYVAFSARRDGPREWPVHVSWYAGIALAALAAVHLGESRLLWVPAVWAVMVTIYYWVGDLVDAAPLRRQALVLAVAVAALSLTDNVLAEGAAGLTSPRAVAMLASASFVALAFVRALIRRGHLLAAMADSVGGDISPEGWAGAIGRRLDIHGYRLLFFVPAVLLTTALGLHAEGRFLTAAWAVEAVALFFVTLPIGERSFRWFSLALLLLAVARVVSIDVWALEPLGRIVSFTALGGALLIVSFLYARFRERVRRYL